MSHAIAAVYRRHTMRGDVQFISIRRRLEMIKLRFITSEMQKDEHHPKNAATQKSSKERMKRCDQAGITKRKQTHSTYV